MYFSLQDATSETSEPYSVDDDPYSIRDDQQKYYMGCFAYLLEKSQGHFGTKVESGAIKGADPAVQEFFAKSNLGTKTFICVRKYFLTFSSGRDQLRQIWTLADVNQDGWLNVNEFALAMHLIVMHIKGGVPLPEYLPAHVHIPSTPPRTTPPLRSPNKTSKDGGGKSSPPPTPRNVWPQKKSVEDVARQRVAQQPSASPQLPNFQTAPPEQAEKPIAMVPGAKTTSKDLADGKELSYVITHCCICL